MPNEMNAEVLRHLARLGAQARLEQIEMERRAIIAAFPDLAPARGKMGRPPGAKAASPQAPVRKRRRHRMTAAQRKAVSERMTRYWAERRKTKGK